MHGGDRGDVPQAGDPARQRARQAVPAGGERRAGDQHVRFQAVELDADGACGVLRVVTGEIVTADDGRLDARAVAQCGFERAARTGGAGLDGDADVGLVLAADAPEELVDVMHDAQRSAHGAILQRPGSW